MYRFGVVNCEDEMVSTELKAVEYPAWSEFAAFEKSFMTCLAKIAEARRRQSIQERMEKDGVVHILDTEQVTGLYTPDVLTCIDDGLSLLRQGAVGEWLLKVRQRRLDGAVQRVRQEFRTEEIAPVGDERRLVEWHRIREYQERERDLRFFGEYAILSGRFHWNTWLPCATTKSDVAQVVKRQKQFRTGLEKLLTDRYLYRHLPRQNLVAIPHLMQMLEELMLSLEFVVSEAPELHPFQRYHADDGRGVRQAVAVELVDLCLLCFGQCPQGLLGELLAGVGAELPSALSKWLTDQIEVAHDHLKSQELVKLSCNVWLPREEGEDPRRPEYPVFPWLDQSLG